jgi:TonB family protein
MVRRLGSSYYRDRSLGGEEWLGGMLSVAGHAAILIVLTAIASQRPPAIPTSDEIFGVFVPIGVPDGVASPVVQSSAGSPAEVAKPIPRQAASGLPADSGVAAPEARSPGDGRSTRSSSTVAAVARSGPSLGLPTAVDSNDWYLSAVQLKVTRAWQAQTVTQDAEVVVGFHILGDGRIADVQVLQSSGNRLVDLAAQRAVVVSGPFSELPSHLSAPLYLKARFRPDPSGELGARW